MILKNHYSRENVCDIYYVLFQITFGFFEESLIVYFFDLFATNYNLLDFNVLKLQYGLFYAYVQMLRIISIRTLFRILKILFHITRILRPIKYPKCGKRLLKFSKMSVYNIIFLLCAVRNYLIF